MGIDAILAQVIILSTHLCACHTEHALHDARAREHAGRDVDEVAAAWQIGELVETTARRGRRSDRRAHTRCLSLTIQLHRHAVQSFTWVGMAVRIVVAEHQIPDTQRVGHQAHVDGQFVVRRSRGARLHALREIENVAIDKGGRAARLHTVVVVINAIVRAARERARHIKAGWRRHADEEVARHGQSEEVAARRIRGGRHQHHVAYAANDTVAAGRHEGDRDTRQTDL